MLKGGFGRVGLHASAAAAALAVFVAPVAAIAQARIVQFNIPAQNLGAALRAFGLASGQSIMFSEDDVRGKTSPALQGAFNIDEALARLLAGSGLAVKRTADGVIYLGGGAGGQADPAPSAPEAQPSTVKEVVVTATGTLIRGIAPVGTNVVQVSRNDIAATGATSTQDLMATIPQITNDFNAEPTVGTGVGGLTIVRPNIRNLAANGGNTTLVLLDGHNMVGAGVLQTTADVGVIPPGALERIDVVPDGGSSLYGSDAIGGIVNLITRKNMEGVEIDGHYGFADHYEAGDANITAGHKWSTGSFLISYDYRSNSDLYGANRDYFRQNLTPFGGSDFRVTACQPGNVAANGVNYALPTRQPNTTNLCDQDLDRDIIPAEQQNSVFSRLSQRVSDGIDFDATFYYTNRETQQLTPQDATSGVVIDNTNPYFQSIAGETQQTVAYNYSGAFGPTVTNTTSVEEYGFTPQLTFKLGGDWRLTTLANFGQSTTTAHSPEINSTAEAAALAGTTTATALDPYDIAASNPAVLKTIHNYEQYAQSTQRLAELRAIADGSVIRLPGGDLRLAAGAQFQYQDSSAVQTDAPVGDLTGANRAQADRRVAAVFGEALVPIIGPDNAVPGVRALSLDASARYDHYSDFGGTTNPKIGLSYKPVDDLTIRGNWGTSFNAPSLADMTGAVDTRAQVIAVSPFQQTFSVANLLRPTILLAGGNPHLRPQTADTYSIGGDYRPSQLKGLTLSVTYWNVALKNVIEVTPFYSPEIFTNPALAKYYVLNPTLAQAEALIGNEHIQGPSLATMYAGGVGPYAIFNAERNNLGTLNVDGLDFNAVYKRNTPLGLVTASVAGTYTLERTSTIAGSAPYDELKYAGISPLQLSGSLGTHYKSFTARVLVNYSAGFSITGIPNQTRVDGFTPVNLYFAYDLNGGWARNTTLTLNIDNIGDVRPPFENQTSTTGIDGTANGATLGRLVNFGVHKKF